MDRVQHFCYREIRCFNFIEVLSKSYDIVLWTASLKEYADPVMDPY